MNQQLETPPAAWRDSPPADSRSWPAWTWWPVGIALGMHAVFAWLTRPAGVLTGQDDATYLMLARGLRSFEYVDRYAVGLPRHGLYPPGYPALLSMWGFLTGDSFTGFVVLGIVCSVAGLTLAWLLFRELLPLWVAIAGVYVLALNPYLVEYASAIASEAPYLFLSLFAVWLAGRETFVTPRTVAAVVALAVFAALTRAVGVTLILALALWWIVRGRWRRAMAVGFAAVLVLLPWFAWIAQAPERAPGKSYVGDVMLATGGSTNPAAIVASRLARNVPDYLLRGLPSSLAMPTIPGTPIDNAVILVVITGSLLGGMWLMWRTRRLEAVYLASYFGLLMVWAYAVRRFVYPLLPLVILALLIGLTAIAIRVFPKRGMVVPLAFACILVVSGSWQTAGMVRSGFDCKRGGDLPDPSCLQPDQASFFDAVRYIVAELPADARLVSAKGETLWYHTAPH